MLDDAINLNWFEGLFTTGSHHALVHKTSYKDEIPTTMVDGTPFDGDPSKPHPCATPSALWDVQGVVAAGPQRCEPGRAGHDVRGRPGHVPGQRGDAAARSSSIACSLRPSRSPERSTIRTATPR
jgi:hypothetical protein